MARVARLVLAGIPHHIIQRGNRRQRTFFKETDHLLYLTLMSKYCAYFQTDVWAYCLMPNHVHLIAVPGATDNLRLAIGEAHQHYTRVINHRQRWKGHLWQDRFRSYPMDIRHMLTAVKYIELNPVNAGMCSKPEDYPWSSARAHLSGKDDRLVKVKPLLDLACDWKDFLDSLPNKEETKVLQAHERSGLPLGSMEFIKRTELMTGRILVPGKRGPKSKSPMD